MCAKVFDPNADIKAKLKKRKTAAKAVSDAKTYDSQWRKLSLNFRAKNPWCVECLGEGFVVEARHVDHKIPVVQRPDLRLDTRNLQSLCVSCHSRKTAKEVGFQGKPQS